MEIYKIIYYIYTLTPIYRSYCYKVENYYEVFNPSSKGSHRVDLSKYRLTPLKQHTWKIR